jgi:hypothetical protein
VQDLSGVVHRENAVRRGVERRAQLRLDVLCGADRQFALRDVFIERAADEREENREDRDD